MSGPEAPGRHSLGLMLAALAILLWSSMATLAAMLNARHLDPLLITAIGLLIGACLSLPRWRTWRVPIPTAVVGIGGILGYHILYFFALGAPDVVTANLVNYLWPLLMVLLAPLILGGGWGVRPLSGALLGLAGTCVLLLTHTLHVSTADLHGCELAGGAALVWAVYSLFTAVLPPFPSSAVGGFCAVAGCCAFVLACLRAGVHAVLATLGGLDATSWILLVAIGVGPLGIAFLCWDAALKRANPRAIAACAYGTPLLSTLSLTLFHHDRPTVRAFIALALIIAGAFVANWGRQPAEEGEPR